MLLNHLGTKPKKHRRVFTEHCSDWDGGERPEYAKNPASPCTREAITNGVESTLQRLKNKKQLRRSINLQDRLPFGGKLIEAQPSFQPTP